MGGLGSVHRVILLLWAWPSLSWRLRSAPAGRSGPAAASKSDLDTFHAATVCLPTGRQAVADDVAPVFYKELSWDEKARWRDIKAMWKRWYVHCRERAISRQKSLYSWARTLAAPRRALSDWRFAGSQVRSADHPRHRACRLPRPAPGGAAIARGRSTHHGTGEGSRVK